MDEKIDSVSSGEGLKKIDSGYALRCVTSGAINVASFGFSGILKHAEMGKDMVKANRPLMDQAIENVLDFGVSAFDVPSSFASLHFTIDGALAVRLFE